LPVSLPSARFSRTPCAVRVRGAEGDLRARRFRGPVVIEAIVDGSRYEELLYK